MSKNQLAETVDLVESLQEYLEHMQGIDATVMELADRGLFVLNKYSMKLAQIEGAANYFKKGTSTVSGKKELMAYHRLTEEDLRDIYATHKLAETTIEVINESIKLIKKKMDNDKYISGA